MSRIQVLELPTIYRADGDDETPFVLIIDQIEDVHAFHVDGLRELSGARGVFLFEGTVEIPANQTAIHTTPPAPSVELLCAEPKAET